MLDSHAQDYVTHLAATGPARTAQHVSYVLTTFCRLIGRSAKTSISATADDLTDYRMALATPAASVQNHTLAPRTQAIHLAVVRGFFTWLRRRRLVFLDAAIHLVGPTISDRVVQKDFLTTQEAQALLATAARRIEHKTPATARWAIVWRDYALLALGLASARRVAGLCATRSADLLIDAERQELRVAFEKGHVGGHVPISMWAAEILVEYQRVARPLIAGAAGSPYLFPSLLRNHVSEVQISHMLPKLIQETCRQHPDLVELPKKHITMHSLRVTCAAMLAANGCDLRVIQRVLLHRRISTTAKYTPVLTDDLRTTLLTAHPRA